MKNPIDLAAQAAAFADKYNMLPQGSTVLCALSGGADSMALLSVLEALAKPRSLTLHAAHFNHQLRGEESQRDEDFVVQWCQKRGIPLVVGRGDVAQEAQEQGKGVEETARAMRYGFLTATAQELGADKIATAHNADDNAETLLLHLARGTGLDGLTGIPPVRGILIRPLLATPRIDIAVYLAQEEIPHVEDSSNQDTVYARNRLRQEVMPVLRDLNPAFVSTLAANLVHLREDRDLLHAMAEKATKTAVVSEGRVSLSARTLAALPHPVAVRAVKQLLAKVDRLPNFLRPFGTDPVPGRRPLPFGHPEPARRSVCLAGVRSAGSLSLFRHAPGLLPAPAHRPAPSPWTTAGRSRSQRPSALISPPRRNTSGTLPRTP